MTANRIRTPEDQSFRLWRFVLVLAVLFALIVVWICRAVELHILDRDFLASEGDARAIRIEQIAAHRGMIVDRNGEPLAVSAPVESLYANPQHLDVSADDIRQLAEILTVDRSWLERRLLQSKHKSFVYLKRRVAPHLATQVMNLSLPGIYVKKEYKRFYPSGEVAAQLVGFTDIDENGQEGIELAYDAWLQGSSGAKRLLKDRRGQVIREFEQISEVVDGRDLMLSLDMRIQYMAYRELKAAVDTHRASSGSLVMLDADNGEILAMVNQPSFNPNNRASLKLSDVRNRAITDVFEPGSTMKLATVAAALESGKFSLDSMLKTSPGYMRVGGKAIRDHRDYGDLSVRDVVAKSSNVGTSKMALELKGDVVWDMFYRLGLGQSTGIGFPGENIGYLKASIDWTPIQVATLSYGYGLNVSLLQLAQAYMVMANGGLKPSIKLLKTEDVDLPERILSEQVSQGLRDAMKAVVSQGGGGTRAQVPWYQVGGKTGTVHRVGKQGYESSDYRAIFAGVAPIDQPQIVVAVMIDSPKGKQYYGGEVAAPVFSRVVESSMRLLDIAPDAKTMEKLVPVVAMRELDNQEGSR